jgi:uncharacterized protein with HEPN domain
MRAQDILDAIAEIQEFVAGMPFERFAADARTLKAVLANFSIIGEAAVHPPPGPLAQAPEIDWREIRRMRNIIVHVSFGVDARIVRQTISDDLPPLGRAVARMLT